MITHTLKDLETVDSAADRAKARGFVERAGMVACMGLPRSELGDLDQIVGLTSRGGRPDHVLVVSGRVGRLWSRSTAGSG